MNKEIQACFVTLRDGVISNLRSLFDKCNDVTQILLDNEVLEQYEKVDSQNELIRQYLSETEGTNFEKLFTKDEIQRSFGEIMQLSEFGVYHPKEEMELVNFVTKYVTNKTKKTIIMSYYDIFTQIEGCLSKISEVTKILKEDDFLDNNAECQKARKLLECKAIRDLLNWGYDSNKNPYDGLRIVIEICKKIAEDNWAYNWA